MLKTHCCFNFLIFQSSISPVVTFSPNSWLARYSDSPRILFTAVASRMLMSKSFAYFVRVFWDHDDDGDDDDDDDDDDGGNTVMMGKHGNIMDT